MKTQLLFVFGMVMAMSPANWVLAQDYNRGAKQELEDVEQMYPKRTKIQTADADQTTTTQVDVTRVQTRQVQPAPATTLPAAKSSATVSQAAPAQPIYILQQPTTNVEATPVKESRAEQLKRQREEFEHQNENKLIEKLEDDRLNAEKERLDKLMSPMTTAQPAPAAAPTPVVQERHDLQLQQQNQQPIPVIVVNQPVVEKEEIKPQPTPVEAQTKSALNEELKEEKKPESGKLAIGGLIGVGNYTTVSNVNGAYALGGMVEYTMPNRLAIEGTVTYSSYDVQNAGYCYYCYSTTLVTTMNQWDITGGVKYKFLSGSVTPVAGGLLGYTRRDYQSRVSWGYGTNSATGSNAFDGGLLIGVEVRCTDNISVGGDFRYMMNISYRTDNPLAYGYFGSSVYAGSPIEGLNYYIAGVSTRISF